MSPTSDAATRPALTLGHLELCFEGVVPAVIASASADGTPNITYLSRIRMVDDDHVALSNQFFSKTTRNLAENPRASLLLIDPVTFDEFRLTVVYERTERRGRVFEQLREDVDMVASLSGMADVFKLRAADIYRVLDIEQVLTAVHRQGLADPVGVDPAACGAAAPSTSLDPATLGELHARLVRCGDLDSLVTAALDALDSVLGFPHSLFLLLDEAGERLFTIATHGYEEEGVGSEVKVGNGIIGLAAARASTIRVGNLRQMGKYSRTVVRSYEGHGVVGPGYSMPVPGLVDAESRVAVPAIALGQLVGVLSVDSHEQVAFTSADEAYLGVVASMLANAVEIERAQERAAEDDLGPGGRPGAGSAVGTEDATATSTRVRFFAVDGSTFLDDDYLIKGVAGRILWSLLRHHHDEGRVEFTNREVRLDPTLELPEFRDNFESRLILLKRRLEERGAPIRIEKTGRGRFRLQVDAPLRLEAIHPAPVD
ncbi:MAG: pyridoxamine 5'-phosphate oxidase family protein [Acidimicrobiales bacterium]